MGRRGKRRREARRERRERPARKAEPGAPEQGRPGESPERAGTAGPAPISLHRSAQKRRRRAGRRLRLRVSPWLIATPLAAVLVALLAVVFIGSGSSNGGGEEKVVVDPRVAGLTPVASFTIEAGDDGTGNNSYFRPSIIRAPAGEVIELVVKNVGSVSHNLRVSGPDKEYETADDFESQPYAIKPGETGRVILKIDPPGSYPFRCDFHRALQIGTLVLQ